MTRERMFGPTALATPANAITVLRILGSIVLGALILRDSDAWALAAFIVLAITDNVDGAVARFQGPTRSGAFLDPLADKVLVAVALIALVVKGDVWWLPAALILAREVAMSVYRSFLVRRGVSLPASGIAKFKTFVTMTAIGLVLIQEKQVQVVGQVLLWVGVGLAWLSFADYLRHSREIESRGKLDVLAADEGVDAH